MYNKNVINRYPRSEKKKSNKKLILNLSLIIIICSLVFLFITQGVRGTDTIEMKKIEIDQGDSLWRIVKKNYSSQINIRKKIYQIRKINNLTSANLQPNQVIKIPKK